MKKRLNSISEKISGSYTPKHGTHKGYTDMLRQWKAGTKNAEEIVVTSDV